MYKSFFLPKLIFSVTLLLILLASGCKTIKTTAPPQQVQQMQLPPTELSQIQMPIQIPLAPLNTYINNMVPQELYYGKDIEYNESIKATIRVLRNGPINVDISSGVIRTTIPIKVVDSYVLFDFQTILFGSKKGAQPFTAAAVINTLTNLGVDKDWNITAKTISSFSWTEEPKLNVAGFNIPLGRLADAKLNQEMKEYLPQLDQYVRKAFNLRSMANSLHTQLMQPIMLLDTPAPLWLTVRIQECNFAPISNIASNIQLNIGVKAFLETGVGVKPELTAATPKLPTLMSQPATANNFSIHLPIELSYNTIGDVARRQLIGKQFPVNDKVDIVITDLAVYTSASKLVLMVDLFSPQKRTKGKVYLLGNPEYNPNDSTLRIKNIDFDINSKNVLLKSANWLLHGVLQKKLEQQSVISIASLLREAKTQLETTINNFRPTKEVSLQASVKNLTIDAIIPRDSTVRVYIAAHGDLQANVVMTQK